jgi:hypothetical protein
MTLKKSEYPPDSPETEAILKFTDGLTKEDMEKMHGSDFASQPQTVKDQFWFFFLKLRVLEQEDAKKRGKFPESLEGDLHNSLSGFEKKVPEGKTLEDILTPKDIKEICGILYKYFGNNFVFHVGDKTFSRSSNPNPNSGIEYV